jgi:hypothetical protein
VEACADRMIHLRFSLGFRPCRFQAVEVVGRGINRWYFSGIFLRSVLCWKPYAVDRSHFYGTLTFDKFKFGDWLFTGRRDTGF